jgi:hypothetical protein
MRTPKYEFILEEWERRPSLSHEKDFDGDDQYLLGVHYQTDENQLILECTRKSYELQLGKLEQKSLKTMMRGVNIYALCLPPRNKLSTSSPAEATARHHGKQTLRASGLDESQKSATKQASRNEPACDSNS